MYSKRITLPTCGTLRDHSFSTYYIKRIVPLASETLKQVILSASGAFKDSFFRFGCSKSVILPACDAFKGQLFQYWVHWKVNSLSLAHVQRIIFPTAWGVFKGSYFLQLGYVQRILFTTVWGVFKGSYFLQLGVCSKDPISYSLGCVQRIIFPTAWGMFKGSYFLQLGVCSKDHIS